MKKRKEYSGWRATVITDASFCPETNAGGWAAWITVNSPDGEVRRHRRHGAFKKRPGTSVEAELWALENGVATATKLMPKPAKILAQCDCLAALQQLKANPYHKGIAVRHVRGHTSNTDSRSWVNRWCDNQARRHMLKVRRSSIPHLGKTKEV